MGTNFAKDTAQAFLAVGTGGSSLIKTGGGKYGDETLADTLFPKAVNDMMSTDRQLSRAATDKKAADEKTALDDAKPGPPPDLTDQLLKRRVATTGGGLGGTFLTGR